MTAPLRHPLHPALVHFPIACWSLATLADIASLWLGHPAWWLAGVLMAIGTLAALAAMGAGLFELAKIDESDPALRVAHRHMLAAMAAWLAYAASLLLRLDLPLDATPLTAPGALEIGLSVVGFGCLAVAGTLGGTLVYRHGVGVRGRPDRPAG